MFLPKKTFLYGLHSQLSHEPTQFLCNHIMNNMSFIINLALKLKEKFYTWCFWQIKFYSIWSLKNTGLFFKPIFHDISRVPRILRGLQWGRLLVLPMLCEGPLLIPWHSLVPLYLILWLIVVPKCVLNFCVLINFPVFHLLMISGFIPLWLKNTFVVILSSWTWLGPVSFDLLCDLSLRFYSAAAAGYDVL